MNKKNESLGITLYLIILFLFTYLLIKEYTYVHPYKTGGGMFGPRWTYISTRTFTWWFILVGSIILTIPLVGKRKIGFLGLLLLVAVLVRPLVQIKFPEEHASEFYKKRSVALNQIVKHLVPEKDTLIIDQKIKDLDFEELRIVNGTFYFLLYGEDFAFGICYDLDGKLPKENFDRPLKYTKLDENWHQFDYF